MPLSAARPAHQSALRHRRWRATTLAAAASIAIAVVPSLPAFASNGSSQPVAGGSSAGDPYFPGLGNTGYDAMTYSLVLKYDPSTAQLSGLAAITLTPSVALSSFNLDLTGPTVSKVTVNGANATFSQTTSAFVQDDDVYETIPPGELTITPRTPLRAGIPALVTVSYAGTMTRPVDNTGSLFGFVATPDGALVASEAYGASTWYPVNDVPTDKARYTFTITVPKGKAVVANGLPIGKPITRGGWTTYNWAETSPMASYLSTIDIGDYDVTTTKTFTGLTQIDAIDRNSAVKADGAAAFAAQSDFLAYLSNLYGPYPFTSTGGILDDDDLGYALETQSRPLYASSIDQSTVVHELAHQWFGDSVTPKLWADIWLNEGFATYSEWTYAESIGTATLDEQARAILVTDAGDDLWQSKVADPGPTGLYDGAVYYRGALALYELRATIGTTAFDKLVKEWPKKYRYGNASTADFQKLAEQISKKDLSAFFTTWLYTAAKPTVIPSDANAAAPVG